MSAAFFFVGVNECGGSEEEEEEEGVETYFLRKLRALGMTLWVVKRVWRLDFFGVVGEES